MLAVEQWLDEIYKPGLELQSPDDLLPIVSYILDAISASKFSVLNSILELVEYERLSTKAITSLHCMLMACKEYLIQWTDSFHRACAVLHTRGDSHPLMV